MACATSHTAYLFSLELQVTEISAALRGMSLPYTANKKDELIARLALHFQKTKQDPTSVAARAEGTEGHSEIPASPHFTSNYTELDHVRRVLLALGQHGGDDDLGGESSALQSEDPWLGLKKNWAWMGPFLRSDAVLPYHLNFLPGIANCVAKINADSIKVPGYVEPIRIVMVPDRDDASALRDSINTTLREYNGGRDSTKQALEQNITDYLIWFLFCTDLNTNPAQAPGMPVLINSSVAAYQVRWAAKTRRECIRNRPASLPGRGMVQKEAFALNRMKANEFGLMTNVIMTEPQMREAGCTVADATSFWHPDPEQRKPASKHNEQWRAQNAVTVQANRLELHESNEADRELLKDFLRCKPDERRAALIQVANKKHIGGRPYLCHLDSGPIRHHEMRRSREGAEKECATPFLCVRRAGGEPIRSSRISRQTR